MFKIIYSSSEEMAGSKTQKEALDQILIAINDGNKKTHELLRILIEETKNNKNNNVDINQLTNNVTTNENQQAKTFAEVVASTLTNTFKLEESRKQQEKETRIESDQAKKNIGILWRNKLNSRKQAYWHFWKSQKTAEIFNGLIAENPPKMPRKFLPKAIPNEDEEETKDC